MSEEKLTGARIVVIGGGTGSFTLLRGLKNYVQNLTALVNMADDGGSTGILRDEFGVLPPGDVRQCLVALSDSPQLRDLFNYRFDEGSLKGHALGNIFLTAAEKMAGSFAEGVELASDVLKIDGRVLPMTLDAVTLCMRDGRTVRRDQFDIAHRKFSKKRPKLWLEPEPHANPLAIEAIIKADMVVVAPGNLYGSLAPALVVPGVGEALANTEAKCVYVCNLVTKPGQTDDFLAQDFADEIERLAGKKFIDYMIFNAHRPSKKQLKFYAHDGEFPVEFDRSRKLHYSVKQADILASEVWTGANASDPIASARTFIRHDSDKVARQIMRIYFS